MKNNFSKILNDKKVILIINICGVLFGSYLYLFTPFKLIGLLLAFVDLTMVIDQITKYKFYTKFSNKYPNFYFLLFKIIPTFVMAPYIILKGNTFLKISGILFLLVDILTLVNYYKNKFINA